MSGAEIVKKALDEQEKKGTTLPRVGVKKTWRVDWDIILSGFLKKLFGG